MRRKKTYIIWLVVFILSLTILLYTTYLFYLNQIKTLVYLMNVITILDVVIAIIDFRKRFLLPYVNNHRQTYDPESFVDRDDELENVINKINTGQRVIYVSGRLGIGKTQFLHRIIDTVYQTKKILVSSSIFPLYIELKQGESLQESILTSIQVKEDLNNIDLIKKLHQITKSKNIIILLDNANKRLYLEIEESIKTLINLDKNLIFVITAESLEKMYNPIEMSNFTEKEVYEIAAKENTYIDKQTCQTIIRNSNGLPSIIQLLVKQVKLTGELSDNGEIELYIEKICDNLSKDQQNILSTIAFYSLKCKTMPVYTLAKYNSHFTERNLSRLADNGLINYNRKSSFIIIENFFSKILQNVFREKQFQVCDSLYLMTNEQDNNDKYKFMFLLLSNSTYITEDELINALDFFISKQEYHFLIFLFELLDDFRILNKNYDSKNIRKKLLYCYTHSLLELGEYKKAYDYIYSSETWNKDINFRNLNSNLEFDFNYDLAEMDHFFGNFESAINSYLTLINFNITEFQILKCQWAIGHCYRHLGDPNSLNIAITCFEEIIKKKKDFYIRSYQSLVLIKLFLNDKEYNYKKAFSEMKEYLASIDGEKVKEITTSRQYALYQRLILNNNEKALEILFSALKNLEISGIRIKYDYYFEVAEALRHELVDNFNTQTYSKCLSYYNKALEFATKADDVSLKSVAQLGIILCKILNIDNNYNDLGIVIEICEFCRDKKISYIFNYAYAIKEYLLNCFFPDNPDSDVKKNDLLHGNLFIM